ncbi:hypothetical protein ACFQ3Z_34610 [Streptomyces nogalater]
MYIPDDSSEARVRGYGRPGGRAQRRRRHPHGQPAGGARPAGRVLCVTDRHGFSTELTAAGRTCRPRRDRHTTPRSAGRWRNHRSSANWPPRSGPWPRRASPRHDAGGVCN